jgi:hypothetical protein
MTRVVELKDQSERRIQAQKKNNVNGTHRPRATIHKSPRRYRSDGAALTGLGDNLQVEWVAGLTGLHT